MRRGDYGKASKIQIILARSMRAPARTGSTAEGLLDGWNRSIPVSNKDGWRDPRVAQAYVTLALASDPTSESRTPPRVRIPGAFRKEHYLLSEGQKLWDARDLKLPVLYMRRSRDQWSRPEDLDAMKRDLGATRHPSLRRFPTELTSCSWTVQGMDGTR